MDQNANTILYHTNLEAEMTAAYSGYRAAMKPVHRRIIAVTSSIE